jgi:hypothetical protein
MVWDNPSPGSGEVTTLNIEAFNEGSKGNVTYILERLDSQKNWVKEEQVSQVVNTNSTMYVSIPYELSEESSGTLEFRIMVLLGDVEMDRKAIEPLLIKEETVRDGEALAQQAGDEIFGITLFVIALISVSFGLWMLVVSRRMDMEDEDSNDGLDQTQEVIEEQSQYKEIPKIENQPTVNYSTSQQLPIHPQVATPLPMPLPMPLPNQQIISPSVSQPQLTNDPGIAPLPPTGLPNGWTMEQWEHYGWKYMESFKK